MDVGGRRGLAVTAPVTAGPAAPLDAVTGAFLDACRDGENVLRHAVDEASYPPAFRESWGPRMLARPLFAAESQVRSFAGDLDTVIGLLESLPDRLFDGDLGRYCDHVGITPAHAAVMRRFATGPLTRYGRADAYHDGTGFKLLEINMASNLGGTDRSQMQRALLDVPAFRDFGELHRLGHVDTGERIFAALKAALPARLKGGEEPRCAVVCGRGGVETYGHLLRGFAEMAARFGPAFRLGELDGITERGEEVLLDGKPVDIVLRFFNVDEVCQDAGTAARADILFRAHEEERLLLWSPINGSLYSSKAALALLSDPDLRHTLSAPEAAAVDRVLPRTYVLDRENAAYCRAHREELILKPLRAFGGRGILAGWTLDDQRWAAALEGGLDGQYVVQHRVRPRAEPVVDPRDGGESDWHAVWGVFFTPDGYAGMDVRAAPAAHSAVINYGANPWVRTACVFTSPSG
ncbi:hypothetical protein [Streptomyces sp. NPDC047046]|uniref:hypothetical protein n=1 Tax=Streptomyces sp. NPDC047046 TaxID=3155378 RepID=UPI0033D79431